MTILNNLLHGPKHKIMIIYVICILLFYTCYSYNYTNKDTFQIAQLWKR